MAGTQNSKRLHGAAYRDKSKAINDAFENNFLYHDLNIVSRTGFLIIS